MFMENSEIGYFGMSYKNSYTTKHKLDTDSFDSYIQILDLKTEGDHRNGCLFSGKFTESQFNSRADSLPMDSIVKKIDGTFTEDITNTYKAYASSQKMSYSLLGNKRYPPMCAND